MQGQADNHLFIVSANRESKYNEYFFVDNIQNIWKYLWCGEPRDLFFGIRKDLLVELPLLKVLLFCCDLKEMRPK
jgi:hypothetical protein